MRRLVSLFASVVFVFALLPTSARALWSRNPLGTPGSWVDANGRTWETVCDMPWTGRNACRTTVLTQVIERFGGRYRIVSKQVFNNSVLFSPLPRGVPSVTGLQCRVTKPKSTAVFVKVLDPDGVGYDLTLKAGGLTTTFAREVGTQRFSFYADNAGHLGDCAASIAPRG